MPKEVKVFFNGQEQTQTQQIKSENNRRERNRLITHLGRMHAGNYELQVLPSGQKGLWACSLDPKVLPEIERYISGRRDTLDDLPQESFRPRQILYDEEAAQEMSMNQIDTILRHEASHAKRTDFRSMFEGQRRAKDEGYLPTSFWLAWEGMEDPRINSLEGEESPAIDRLIRTNQAVDLQERLTETPLSQRPLMLQFAYNSFHYWLHGETIPELAGTEAGRVTERALPLLGQYFDNTDPEERKILQRQIWDIAKQLEKKEIEQEEQRQMARQKQIGQQQSGDSQQEGETSGDSGEGQGSSGQNSKSGNQQQQASHRGFFDRMREELFGSKDPERASTGGGSKKPEKIDLAKLSPDELREIRDAIGQLSPRERDELTKKARVAVDEEQKEALDDKLSKTLKLEKNKRTGDYEARLQTPTQKQLESAENNYQEAVEETEAEEREQREKETETRKQQAEAFRQQEAARREEEEMKKAGFDVEEREKFLLYQSLEGSMNSHTRNFEKNIERDVPRKKEPVYEGGYFSGSKFDRRELIRRAPLKDERFHMRQVERPTGEPRLFVGLLIDNTGSMSGKKMEEARKTTIFFAKVCDNMGIPFMATAFGDHAEIIKQFRQDLGNPSERIKPNIIDATSASDSSTNLHDGLDKTIKAMNEQRRRLPDSHGIIFVITDGGINAGLTGDALRNYIDDNRGRLTFKAFVLSADERERSNIQPDLNNYFGETNCAYPIGFENLPVEAYKVLRTNFIRFKRFLT